MTADVPLGISAIKRIFSFINNCNYPIDTNNRSCDSVKREVDMRHGNIKDRYVPYTGGNNMTTVGKLLEEKPSHLWSISPEATVFSALELMAEKNVGALLVMDSGKLVGIFSERDYARKVILRGKASKETYVHELMTREILYATNSMTMHDCMALMTSKNIRHLPVLEKDKVAGIITVLDVVRRIISEQAVTINDLRQYITGDDYVSAHVNRTGT